LTLLGLIGTAASVIGNEAAIRFGRRRLIGFAMLVSAVIGACIGFVGSASYSLAIAMLVLYGFFIWLDSSSLTAGSAGTAEPSRRGATLAVHSTLGYAGGFVGPLIVGFILDLGGGMSRTTWGFAFLAVAALMLAALAIFWAMRPRDLAGDRGDSQ
jgi:MFS family permease